MKFTKLLVLGALLLTGSGVAKAVDANVWPKPTIAAPEVTTFTTYEVGKTVYLYNVASHLFFTSGNDWGTRASLIYATNGNGSGATAGEAVCGVTVEFTQTDEAKAKGDDVVELKSFVPKFNEMRSSFADGAASIWTDNNTNDHRFWKVTRSGNCYLISNVTTDPDKFLGWQGDFTDTRLYLLDAGVAGIEWQMVDEAVYNEWLTAVQASDIDLAAVKTAAEIYKVAMELKAVLDEAESKGINVDEWIAVYNNTNSTIEDLNAAIDAVKEAIAAKEKEDAQGDLTKATAENPADATAFINNPDWAGGSTKGWSQAPSLEKHGDIYTAEFYNTTYDMNQTLTGLPEGVYSLNLKGFYREGGYSGAAYGRHLTGKENLNAYIYATQENDTVTKPLMSIYKEASETGYGNGTEVTVTYEGKTVYIPNMRESAQIYFNDGRYNKNTMFFNNTGSDFIIGLKKTVGVGTDWTPFNDFTLKYYGKGADAYQMWLNELLKDYSELTIAEGIIYTEQYKTAYDQILAGEKTATNADEVKAIVAEVEAAYDALMLNIELWQKYQELVAKALSVAANEDYNIIYREELGDYEMDLDYNLGARSMTNEELQALCDEINAAIEKAIHAPLAGADMTDLLKNPGFDEGGQGTFPGWNATWKNAGAARVVASCAEFWNTESFDMYQELTELPKGVYEISVQGFYRYLRGTNAWNAYLSKDPNTLSENIPTYIYMNDNQTPFTNVFGDPRRDELQLSPDGTSAPAIYTGTDYVSLTDDNTGNTYFFPDNMQSSADCFGQGMYTQKAYGLVAQDGDKLRLGVIGSSNQGGDSWVIFDNFRLTYKGMDADIIKPVLETNIEKAKASLEGYMGKSVRAALTAAVAEAEAALDKDGQTMFNALSAIFATTRAVNESKAKFNSLVAANENLAQAIVSAIECSLETYQEANTLNSTITENLEAGIYEDEDVDGLLKQIADMIKKLAIPEGFADATDDNPKDASWCIVNPKYADNTNEGWSWTSTKNPGLNYNLCEVFDSDFNYYQDIDLTAGTYDLTVPGFYRYGSAAEDYSTFIADPTQNNNLVMYVTLGGDSVAVAMPRLASGAQEYMADVTEAADGNKSFNPLNGYIWVADPVANADSTLATGYIVANNMQQAANEFASKNYCGTTITFKVPEDMSVRIGMSKAVQQENNWCIWGAWQLTYYGKNSAKETTTGINATFNNGHVARTEFYNLNGARISAPQRGIIIVKQTMTDGTVKVRKAVVK